MNTDDLRPAGNAVCGLENRGGGDGGHHRHGDVRARSPDGYQKKPCGVPTRGFSPHCAGHLLQEELPCDLIISVRDVRASSRRLPDLCAVVNPAVPFKSVSPRLIDYAKALKIFRGASYTLRIGRRGSTVHLAGEFLRHAASIDIVQFPYKGSEPATSDMVGGQGPDDVRPRSQTPAARAGRKTCGLGGDLAKQLRVAPESADRGPKKRMHGIRCGGLVRARGRRPATPKAAGRQVNCGGGQTAWSSRPT